MCNRRGDDWIFAGWIIAMILVIIGSMTAMCIEAWKKAPAAQAEKP